jgi:hypothetical protein
MICQLFFVVIGLLLFAWARKSRRIACLVLIGVLTVTLMFPSPTYAQFGLIGGIQNLLNLINGTIRETLNSIGSVMTAIQNLHQQIVWPVQLIQRARSSIDSLISQSRGVLQNIYGSSVRSANLPVPVALETIIRNQQTNDFGALTQAYYRTYGAVPAATDADPLARNLIDIDDAMALGTLKTLKASDRVSELILQSGNQIEDQARSAAPGSAPFLTAASVAANIQSQAMMQKMLAAMIRQEAARIAHDNTRRKRYATLLSNARQNVFDLLKRR